MGGTRSAAAATKTRAEHPAGGIITSPDARHAQTDSSVTVNSALWRRPMAYIMTVTVFNIPGNALRAIKEFLGSAFDCVCTYAWAT